MSKLRYSIITCVSDFEVYERCLLSSLSRLTGDTPAFELIPIDNRTSTYYAPTALNHGIDISHADIIIFCHQDISLMPDFFNYVERALAGVDDRWGVIGCAGRSIDPEHEVGVVYNGHPGEYDSSYQEKLKRSWNGKMTRHRVHSVDECLFIYNKNSKTRFNDFLKGFHFYASDLCMSLIKNKFDVYATYLPVIHHGTYSSSLHTSDNYWKLFRDLVGNWRNDFKSLYGTHMRWETMGESIRMTSNITFDSESSDFSARVLYMTIDEANND